MFPKKKTKRRARSDFGILCAPAVIFRGFLRRTSAKDIREGHPQNAREGRPRRTSSKCPRRTSAKDILKMSAKDILKMSAKDIREGHPRRTPTKDIREGHPVFVNEGHPRGTSSKYAKDIRTFDEGHPHHRAQRRTSAYSTKDIRISTKDIHIMKPKKKPAPKGTRRPTTVFSFPLGRVFFLVSERFSRFLHLLGGFLAILITHLRNSFGF